MDYIAVASMVIAGVGLWFVIGRGVSKAAEGVCAHYRWMCDLWVATAQSRPPRWASEEDKAAWFARLKAAEKKYERAKAKCIRYQRWRRLLTGVPIDVT